MVADLIQLPVRKPDRRTEADELRMELEAHRHEELIFIRRTWGDSGRIVRLIEGGLLAEAVSVAGGLVHASNRRTMQLRNGGDVA